MKKRITNAVPKAENQGRGYYFTVSDQEIKDHRKRSFEDIVSWLETTNKFVHSIQTPEERKNTKRSKWIKNDILG